MTEQRRTQRQRTLKGGMIVYNESRSTLECTVRDLSRGGAHIRVASLIGIPDVFELRLSGGDKHQCEVVWKRGNEIGVKFV